MSPKCPLLFWRLAYSKPQAKAVRLAIMIFMPLSQCGRLADKEGAFRSTMSSNCTEHP